MDGSYCDLNMRMYDISYTERKKHFPLHSESRIHDVIYDWH